VRGVFSHAAAANRVQILVLDVAAREAVVALGLTVAPELDRVGALGRGPLRV
jgi:NADH:ubiquinone oxidoreductase subunit K